MSKPAVKSKDEGSSTVIAPVSSGKSRFNSPECLRAIIDSLEDELIVIDRDYRVIEANNAIMSRLGKSKGDVIGEYCYAVSYGLPEPCCSLRQECPLKQVWETRQPVRVTHIHVSDSDGNRQQRYLDIIASPVVDDRGNMTAITELIRDVTEIREIGLRIVKAHENLSALNSIATVVIQSLDLDTILRNALDKTLEIMQQSTGGILLLDNDKQVLYYRVYRGLSKKYIKGMRLGLGEGIAGRAAQTGEAILVEDISADSRAAHPDLIALEGIRAFVSVPLRSQEKVLGVMNIISQESHKFSTEDINLLEGIAAQITVAIENSMLHQEVQHKDEIRGELLREIFTIQEEERRRIARELHDETSQALTSLTTSLEVIASMLSSDIEGSQAMLRKAQSQSITILDEIQKLIYELRPILLDDLGLVPAIRWLIRNNLETAGVKVNFCTTGRVRRLTHQLETTLFRVTQEAVNNIAKHAHAQKAEISLHFNKKVMSIRIQDNGQGFNVKKAISSGDRPRGLGLLGMRERVELMNGTLDIRSRPHGRGTEIDIEIPLRQEVANG